MCAERSHDGLDRLGHGLWRELPAEAPQGGLYGRVFEAKRLSDTLRTTVRMARIPNLRIVPDQVEVTIPVEEMTSKLLDIPVVPQSVPAGWSLITFPSSVQLTCMMPFSRFASVSEESFCWVSIMPTCRDVPLRQAGHQGAEGPRFRAQHHPVARQCRLYSRTEETRLYRVVRYGARLHPRYDMKRIGITGGIGSGKSVVSNLLRVMGYRVYDTDSEARRADEHLARMKRQIAEAFGDDIYAGGSLNRPCWPRGPSATPTGSPAQCHRAPCRADRFRPLEPQPSRRALFRRVGHPLRVAPRPPGRRGVAGHRSRGVAHRAGCSSAAGSRPTRCADAWPRRWTRRSVVAGPLTSSATTAGSRSLPPCSRCWKSRGEKIFRPINRLNPTSILFLHDN